MYVRIAATEKLCGFESAALPLYRDGGGPLTTVLVFRSSRGGYVSDCNPTETYIRTASKQPYSISVGGVWGVPVRKARASRWIAHELWPFIMRRPAAQVHGSVAPPVACAIVLSLHVCSITELRLVPMR